ncbi:MAG TPA: carbohydrate ABC transporter permease, partial [Clostridia bacterium]|nr:carbohydrate ABC transporter permease [Clostridia bacterium]
MATQKRRIRSLDDLLVNSLACGIGALVIVATLYPLLFVISASFSDPVNVLNGDLVLWPIGFNLEGYQKIFNYSLIWLGYRNTLLYAVLGTLVNLSITLPAAYSLSRRDLVGRNLFTAYCAATMFFSGGLIPTYLVMRNLSLVNKPLIMVLLGAVSVWNMVIARTFFQTGVPLELQEAAYIDGASTLRTY